MRKIHDFYFKKAKEEKFLARSAYKLLEIDKRFSILKNISNVLEFGASPGSWSQVLCQRNINVNAIDLNPMKYNHNLLHFIQSDIYDRENIIKQITFDQFDLILSDAACNSTGSDDHIRNIDLLDQIAQYHILLKANGCMVLKTFQCHELHSIRNELKNHFAKIKLFKPASSRKESSEIYILCIEHRVNL